MPDGSGLIVSASGAGVPNNQLWLVSWPDGGVHRITNDTAGYGAVQVMADGKTIVTSQTESETALWMAPAGKLDAAVRVAGESVSNPRALSNGRALFTTGSRDDSPKFRTAPESEP